MYWGELFIVYSIRTVFVLVAVGGVVPGFIVVGDSKHRSPNTFNNGPVIVIFRRVYGGTPLISSISNRGRGVGGVHCSYIVSLPNLVSYAPSYTASSLTITYM
jgi:hypothetical protein